MKTFISDTIDDILQTTKTFENTIFVLPSQRATVFVKKELKEKIEIGFLPKIINIEEFVSDISGINKLDSISLLFKFYSIYKIMKKKPESFDVFSSWAYTVLQDFSELDQYLVKTNDIFVYLRDITRLRKWSIKGKVNETSLIKNYNEFTEKLNEYYNSFYEYLIKKKIGYKGILYREAVKKIDNYIFENSKQHFFLIGFNALSKSEEFIFNKILSKGNGDVYWDIDNQFLNNNHQAGFFIRKYRKQWSYYNKNNFKTIANNFSTPKNIQVIGASKNITQVKYTSEILSKLKNYDSTAMVFADEALLPVALNSFPEKVKNINITMGYPLKDIPITNLFFSIFQLFISQEKLQIKNKNLFHYKDVIKFIKQFHIYKYLTNSEGKSISDDIYLKISSENSIFITQEFINSFLGKHKFIQNIFNKLTTIDEFIQRINNLITLLKFNSNELEKEYLFRFYNIFTQLQNLNTKYGYLFNIKILFTFFKQLIETEKLSFKGEPLQGLQLMGVLETRTLDFENVIITSVNENILPDNFQQNSFIPFDVKLAFGLPTYREKDKIFSYHFFRLIQRAKNIYILFNTNNDDYGSGEKSRFITQLELITKKIDYKIISPKVVTDKIQLKKIKKNELILKKLKEIAIKGISPSTLALYLYNPIKFYKQKILNVKEFNDIQQDITSKTLGTVIHNVLDELYTPFINSFLTFNMVLIMELKVNKLTQKFFNKHFISTTEILTGKNRLIFEVAIKFIKNFLKQEKKLLRDKKNKLKILATEENLSVQIHVKDIDFPIKIHGQVDRIDELNGIIRVIDYKTGIVNKNELKIVDFKTINDYKYSKSIQVLLYAFLYVKSKKIKSTLPPLETGIISFKNLNTGLLKLNFSSNNKQADYLVTDYKLTEFINEIKNLLSQIYDKDYDFEEPMNLTV